MKKVAGYLLNNVNVQDMDLPVGSQILGVNSLYGTPKLYAIIDMSELGTEKRKVHCIKSDFPMPDIAQNLKYIGTYNVESFGNVFHVFEELNEVSEQKSDEADKGDEGTSITKKGSAKKASPSVGGNV